MDHHSGNQNVCERSEPFANVQKHELTRRLKEVKSHPLLATTIAKAMRAIGRWPTYVLLSIEWFKQTLVWSFKVLHFLS